MTPLRLLILACLFYLGWRLLRRKAPQESKASKDQQVSNNQTQDVLVEDPVCHVLVPQHQALQLRRDGVTYYFCSEQCCDTFAGQPEKETS
mgnify:CR=1 FL=1